MAMAAKRPPKRDMDGTASTGCITDSEQRLRVCTLLGLAARMDVPTSHRVSMSTDGKISSRLMGIALSSSAILVFLFSALLPLPTCIALPHFAIPSSHPFLSHFFPAPRSFCHRILLPLILSLAMCNDRYAPCEHRSPSNSDACAALVAAYYKWLAQKAQIKCQNDEKCSMNIESVSNEKKRRKKN